jgi:alkyldihydroxyacetonephosphate synthase
MRWWGWGEDGHDVVLPATATVLLQSALGVEDGERRRPPPLEDIRLPAQRLPGAVRERLAAIVGPGHARDDHESRVTHAAGRSYPDLVRLRSGELEHAPDLVLFPGSAEEVGALLGVCSEARVAVVPFGGGTSVVGGVEPVADGFAGAVTLVLSRLDGIFDVDPVSLTATLEAGLYGPEAERRLAADGLTLGHFPQSFEFSTVGGWVATRSAGQASTGYGRIDELVEALRCVAPAGEISTRAVPASAAGPDLRELLVGSEGTLGVICEATLRLRPAPEKLIYEGWSFRTFAEGCEAFRVMEQRGASPDVARLSDEHETALGIALASTGSGLERLGRRYLRLRGHEGGCIAITGFEGEPEDVERRRGLAGRQLRAGGGVHLGGAPGERWLRTRYAAPYLRDELLDRGVMAETLETATVWSNLSALYGAVRSALQEALGDRAMVMCHVSHLYPSGASLYFTFLARQEDDALAQWQRAKAAASEAIATGRGTITHHHAVGRDHAPWMRAEVGELGLGLLQAAKARLDPAGIMNPAKLLPPG